MSYEDEEPSSLISCDVCGAMLDITNKREQHVVKCDFCKEATVSIWTVKTCS